MKRTMTLLTIAVFALSTTTAIEAATQTTKFPVATVLGNPCAPEAVFLEGTVHLSIGFTANANSIHTKWHTNYSGVKGIGLLSGAKYVANGTSNEVLNLQKGGNYTLVETFNLIGQGPIPNYKTKAHWQITVNANGEVSVFFIKFEATCQ